MSRCFQEAVVPAGQPSLPPRDLRQPATASLQVPELRHRRGAAGRERCPDLQVPIARAVRLFGRLYHGDVIHTYIHTYIHVLTLHTLPGAHIVGRGIP